MFNSLQDSVRSYQNNINRNRAYKELRALREEMRANNQPLNSYELATGLHRYSQKGKKYVKIIQSILKSDEFQIVENILKGSTIKT